MTYAGVLKDSYNRIIRDLRISITDRCNFHCVYCLPETEEAANFYRPIDKSAESQPAATKLKYPWKPRSQMLTLEEIAKVAKASSSLGVTKIRLTGGEPLLRKGVDRLISLIADIDTVKDLSLTTNGYGFPSKAMHLKDAGLGRVTISLDSLDRDNFTRITGRDGLTDAVESIRLAKAIGLTPVKVNAVIIRGLNDHEIEALAKFALKEEIIMRFIEFMPLGSRQTWQNDHVVSGAEIIDRINAIFKVEQLPANHPAETSTRWLIGQGSGEIGIIAPVTQPFCGNCNRIRLTADGKIRTCLFSLHEHDIKPALRDGSGPDKLAACLQQIAFKKEPGHRIGKTDFVQPARTMSRIGG